MASYKVCVFIALACAFAACSAEEHAPQKRFISYPYGLGAAALPVTSYASIAAPVIAPAVTSFAAPAVHTFAAPAVTSHVVAAPAIPSFGYAGLGYAGLGYPLLKK